MNQTQNLGLPVYGANDKPSWMDTNNGFEKLDNIVGGVANVHLDFANPLYTFDSTHTSYTAVKDCYLYGTIMGTDSTQCYIEINGTKIAGTFVQANSSYPPASIAPLLLKEGDVVTATNLSTYAYRNALGVYEGEIVSDSFVWNEAIVELDYANPLHTFTTGNLSYTATKNCWLCGSFNNTSAYITIDGTKLILSYYGTGYVSDPYVAPLRISKGSTVVASAAAPELHIFDGEIKGSAPGFAGSGDVLELLDFDNEVTLTTTNITTTKAGAIVVSGFLGSGVGAVYINNNLYGRIGSNAGTDTFVLNGIPKGTLLKIGATDGTFLAHFVPYKYESIAPEITVYNEVEVELDYANPLHTFTRGESSEQTYTATQTCYLVGNWAPKGTSITDLYINNTPIYSSLINANDCISPNVFLKLSAGDVVKVPNLRDYAVLQVLKGTVSGSVGNLTGAWIPNYSDHIASLTYNGGTYTATQDCIVEFGMLTDQNGTIATIQVNGNKIGRACSYSNGIVPFDKQIKLKKGDIFTWSHADATSFFGEVYGLM